MPVLVLLILAATAAFAGESAVLASGARLHVDRHETEGAHLRLYTGSGYVEMPAGDVVRFEADEPVAGAAAAVPPASSSAPAAQAMLAPQQLADAAADRWGLPRKLVRSVMAAESNFEPGAVSPKGAIGLMQLMPSTAQILGANPHDPAQNVDAGARYLRELLEKYNGGLRHALAAYNAGPAAVDKYNGVPPFSETIRYVGRIEREFKKGD